MPDFATELLATMPLCTDGDLVTEEMGSFWWDARTVNRVRDIMAALRTYRHWSDEVQKIHDIPKDDSWVGQYYAAVKEKLAAEAHLWEVYDG